MDSVIRFLYFISIYIQTKSSFSSPVRAQIVHFDWSECRFYRHQPCVDNIANRSVLMLQMLGDWGTLWYKTTQSVKLSLRHTEHWVGSVYTWELPLHTCPPRNSYILRSWLPWQRSLLATWFYWAERPGHCLIKQSNSSRWGITGDACSSFMVLFLNERGLPMICWTILRQWGQMPFVG